MSRQPITWQNVNAPDLTGAARLTALASRQFDQAFNSARGINDIFGEHRENTLDANAQDFTNRLMQQYSDPDALLRAQQSGEIDALAQRYGNNLRAEDRGADVIQQLARESQDRIIQDQTYRDNQDRVQARGTLAKVDKFIYKGQNDKAAQYLQQAIDEGRIAPHLAGDALKSIDAENIADADRQRQLQQWRNADIDRSRRIRAEDLAAQRAEEQRMQEQATVEFNKKWARNVAEKNTDELAELWKDPANPDPLQSWQQLTELNDNKTVDTYANQIIEQRVANKSLSQQAVDLQNRLQQDLGINISELTNPNFDLATLDPESLMQIAFTQGDIAGLGVIQNKSRDALTRQFMEQEGATYTEASRMVGRIQAKIDESLSVPESTLKAREKEFEKLAGEFGNDSLIVDSINNVKGDRLSAIFGDETDSVYERIRSMDDADRKAADQLVQWVNLGEIPAGAAGFGQDAAIPLTKAHVKYLFNTATDDTGIWDFTGENMIERAEEIADLITPEQIDNYQLWLKRKQELENQHLYQDNPEALRQPLPSSDRVDAALKNLQNANKPVSTPTQAAPKTSNKPETLTADTLIPAKTNETFIEDVTGRSVRDIQEQWEIANAEYSQAMMYGSSDEIKAAEKALSEAKKLNSKVDAAAKLSNAISDAEERLRLALESDKPVSGRNNQSPEKLQRIIDRHKDDLAEILKYFGH